MTFTIFLLLPGMPSNIDGLAWGWILLQCRSCFCSPRGTVHQNIPLLLTSGPGSGYLHVEEKKPKISLCKELLAGWGFGSIKGVGVGAKHSHIWDLYAFWCTAWSQPFSKGHFGALQLCGCFWLLFTQLKLFSFYPHRYFERDSVSVLMFYNNNANRIFT